MAEPHPESILRAASGHVVQLKAHQCRWSGQFAGNSLPALRECLQSNVARAEIDIRLGKSGEFVVGHDAEVGGEPTLQQVVDVLRSAAGVTVLELDMMDVLPLGMDVLAELVRVVEPVRQRVLFNSSADWNLRRLLRLEPTLRVAFELFDELDVAEDSDLPLGAYGYHDAHPLARQRSRPAHEYLFDRLGGVVRLVPGAEELHVRFATFERMLDDDFSIVDFVHQAGLRVDLWTLDAGTPVWRERLQRAVEAGADVVTTNTPRELARAL